MNKILISSILILISLFGRGQNILNQSTYCFLFCGTTASDTNTFSFLKSTYENAISNLKNDSLLILLELSEDEIFIQRHEETIIFSDLYELEEYSLVGKKSRTGKILQSKYARFYYDIIENSLRNPKIILRGYKNPIQRSQISWIKKYYPELISETDSIEILYAISNNFNINFELQERIKYRLNSITIENWDKAYIETWIEDLRSISQNEKNQNDEVYWSDNLKPINKKIILSPYSQVEDDYIPSYLKEYFVDYKKVVLSCDEVVLTRFDNFKSIRNKKYKLSEGFTLHNTDDKIFLFDYRTSKYTGIKLNKGSYFGKW